MSLSAEQRTELFKLLDLLREQQITQTQIEQLEGIVLGNPAAMDAYVRYMAVAASLRSRLQTLPTLPPITDDRVSPPASPTPHTRATRSWKHWAGVTAIAAACVAVVLVFATGQRQAASVTIGSLETIQGQAHISRAGEKERIAEVGAKIATGDTLRTNGLGGLAVLRCLDGTRLTLFGDTFVTCDSTNRNRVTVQQGVLAAQVMPQPADNPFELVTAQGTTRVLGTELALESQPTRTELTVTEGRVQFTRSKDGKSVEIPQGKRVVDGPQDDLVVSNIPRIPVTWKVDFETGLPKRWRLGQAVHDDLPDGAKGAVISILDPQHSDPSYAIVTNHDWADGLFTVQENSCLRMTYKFERPGWIQVFMGTRKPDLVSATGADVYLLEPWEASEDERWWDVPAGKWHTVSMPLAEFFKITDRSLQPVPGDVCFGFTFHSQEHDRGFVIDDIQISSDGPQSVEFKAIRQ